MWKKIVYYAGTIIMGILFMFAFAMVQYQNTEDKIVKKAVKNDTLENVLRLDTQYVNATPVYSANLTDGASVRVFETASITTRTVGKKKYSMLDYAYTIVLVNDQMTKTNQQDPAKNYAYYNLMGYTVEGSAGDFTYYNIGTVDGYKISPSAEYGDFETMFFARNQQDIYEFTVSCDFMNEVGMDHITSITLNNSTGTAYHKIVVNLGFDSAFMLKIKELKDEYNAAVITNTNINSFYKTWKESFLSNDSFEIGYTSKNVITASYYVKIVLMLIAYIIIILAIGDTIVGKKRILNMFNNRGTNRGQMNYQQPQKKSTSEAPILNDDKVVEAEIVDKK